MFPISRRQAPGAVLDSIANNLPMVNLSSTLLIFSLILNCIQLLLTNCFTGWTMEQDFCLAGPAVVMWWCLSDCDWWHDLTELCSPSTHRGRISESQLTLHTNCQSVNHWKLVSCCHDVLCSRVFSHCDGTERSADHITIILSPPPPLRDRDRDVTGNDTRNNRGETPRKIHFPLVFFYFLIKYILTKIQKYS